ncbi:hypothetical protein KKC00_01160, partial [Patescibacteria group bacterium]|nr:hypothetical protein [Patescibacteria group bacterium]
MNDKDLIKTIKGLNQIKPSKDWVVSLKRDIVGERSKTTVFNVLPRSIFHHKLAYATITFSVILVGLFGFAQDTVPGDFLFPVKKIAEKSQGALLSGTEQSV